MHCAVCFGTQNLYSCECDMKIYCSSKCQNLDFDRHSITCNIGGRITPFLSRFLDNEILIVTEFERLTDLYGPAIKFLFSLPENQGLPTDEMRRYLGAWMKNLIDYCNTAEVLQTIESIPVKSHLRTLIVSPLLNRNNNFFQLADILSSIGINKDFLDLLKYPTTGRTLFDMTLYAKWYTHNRVKYIDEPRKNWEIITGAGSEMLPFLKWGIMKPTKKIAIPCSRYQFSKRQGLYYNQGERQYDGTFFYFEPDCPAYITFRNEIIVSPNKIYAFRLLGWSFERFWDESIVVQFDKMLAQEHDGELRFDVIAQELKQHFGYDVISYDEMIRLFYDIPSITYPSPRFRHFWWSIEDVFDQLLYHACVDAGVTGLLLTRMAGYSRTICELLAVDDRPSVFRTMYIVK